MTTSSTNFNSDEIIAVPEPKQNKGSCNVCIRHCNVLKCEKCTYKSCRSCLSSWIKIRVGQGADEITCLNCDQKLTDERVGELCPSSFRRYLYNRSRRQHAGNQEAIWCPKVECLAKLRDGASECHECGTRTCMECLDIAHEGKCPKRDKGNGATEIWKMLNTKECPKCKVRIERDGGCSHIYCAVCKTGFCWECGAYTRDCKCQYAVQMRLPVCQHRITVTSRQIEYAGIVCIFFIALVVALIVKWLEEIRPGIAKENVNLVLFATFALVVLYLRAENSMVEHVWPMPQNE